MRGSKRGGGGIQEMHVGGGVEIEGGKEGGRDRKGRIKKGKVGTNGEERGRG